MELADGCKNEVVSPAAMLKLCQFKTASWLTVTLSCAPSCCAVAWPALTVRPAGLAKTWGARAGEKHQHGEARWICGFW